ncbi:MAG: hypothetical protein Q9219_007157 [cf. Caloplaca sp. 3 TL-2023]
MTKLVVTEWSRKVMLSNGYGPTEACIDACLNDKISPDTEANNIGYAHGTGNRLWVVEPDDHSRLSPVGCLGEILISGPALARGYLNDPEKTSKVFLNCNRFPWALEGDTRYYATGDLGRRNGDGSITIFGRKDLQIQLHGIRIEVEEIEHVLGSCDGVRLAVVDKVEQGDSGFEALVAFLSLETVGHQDLSEPLLCLDETTRTIIGRASSRAIGRLPKYMVPNLYLPVREIPTSVGGKVDRKALRKIYASLSREQLSLYKSYATTGRRPKTEIQITLQQLWAKVLSMDAQQIGLDDDFLILGGNSLAAIKLASLVTQKNLQLGVSDVFKHPRFEDMAAKVQAIREDKLLSDSEDPAPFSLVNRDALASLMEGRKDIEDILPASSVQTSFVIRAQRFYKPYFAWFFIDIDAKISAQELEDACNAVVQRHQVLRTAFHLLGDRIFQIIRKSARANFRVFEVDGDWDRSCVETAQRVSGKPVTLGEIPTSFRLIIQKSSGHRRLAIGLSHAQYDGFCTDAIFSDLYSACVSTLGNAKPPSYARYIRHSIQASQNVETKAFWRQVLKGSRMTTIGSASQPRDAPMTCDVERRIAKMEERPAGITLATLVQTAWSLVLCRVSRSSDVVFGSMVSGRDAPFGGVVDVVGPCLNALPVRVRIDPDQTFLGMMRQRHEGYIATIPYVATPIEQIMQQSPWPSSTRFGSLVLHQNIPGTTVSQEGGSAGPRWKYAGAAVYNNIMIDFTNCWLTTLPDDEGGMRCWLSFNEEAMSTAGANAVIDFFCSVVNKILEQPESKVDLLDASSFDRAGLDSPRKGNSSSTPGKSESETVLPDDFVHRLRALWTSVFLPVPDHFANGGCEEKVIDEETDFFNAGGNSLAAAQLSNSCEESGLDLSLQDIYDFPTLGAQCRVLLGHVDRPKRENPKLVFVSEKELPA